MFEDHSKIVHDEKKREKPTRDKAYEVSLSCFFQLYNTLPRVSNLCKSFFILLTLGVMAKAERVQFYFNNLNRGTTYKFSVLNRCNFFSNTTNTTADILKDCNVRKFISPIDYEYTALYSAKSGPCSVDTPFIISFYRKMYGMMDSGFELCIRTSINKHLNVTMEQADYSDSSGKIVAIVIASLVAVCLVGAFINRQCKGTWQPVVLHNPDEAAMPLKEQRVA